MGSPHDPLHSRRTPPDTGDLAQGRSRVKSYKVHEVESVPREEWVEVAGTHEAIIDYETFDKVQALLQRDTRTSPKGREVHLFSGFLKCADCGRAITRSVGNNNNVYYACSTYKNRSRTACTMHSIKHNRLEAAVLFAVQQQIHLAVSYSEMIARINTAPVKKSQSTPFRNGKTDCCEKSGNWQKSAATSSPFIKTGKTGKLPSRTTGI